MNRLSFWRVDDRVRNVFEETERRPHGADSNIVGRPRHAPAPGRSFFTEGVLPSPMHTVEIKPTELRPLDWNAWSLRVGLGKCGDCF